VSKTAGADQNNLTVLCRVWPLAGIFWYQWSHRN